MVKLQIYVSETCWSCDEARRIAALVGTQFPEVLVDLVDLQEGTSHANVIAVPTYQLDGQTIFLGNPTFMQLSRKLSAALHQ